MPNPTDTARALVEAFEAKVVQLTKAQKFPRSGYLYNAEFQHQNARAALLAHVAGVERDAERLNWLERQVDPLHLEQDTKGGEYTMKKSATLYLFNSEHTAPTIREAIDAAILATRPTEARDS